MQYSSKLVQPSLNFSNSGIRCNTPPTSSNLVQPSLSFSNSGILCNILNITLQYYAIQWQCQYSTILWTRLYSWNFSSWLYYKNILDIFTKNSHFTLGTFLTKQSNPAYLETCFIGKHTHITYIVQYNIYILSTSTYLVVHMHYAVSVSVVYYAPCIHFPCTWE